MAALVAAVLGRPPGSWELLEPSAPHEHHNSEAAFARKVRSSASFRRKLFAALDWDGDGKLDAEPFEALERRRPFDETKIKNIEGKPHAVRLEPNPPPRDSDFYGSKLFKPHEPKAPMKKVRESGRQTGWTGKLSHGDLDELLVIGHGAVLDGASVIASKLIWTYTDPPLFISPDSIRTADSTRPFAERGGGDFFSPETELDGAVRGHMKGWGEISKSTCASGECFDNFAPFNPARTVWFEANMPGRGQLFSDVRTAFAKVMLKHGYSYAPTEATSFMYEKTSTPAPNGETAQLTAEQEADWTANMLKSLPNQANY